MKTTFVKDAEYDAFMIWGMLSRGSDPSGIENRAKRMKIDMDLVRSISGKKYEEVEELIERTVRTRYAEEEAAINNAITNYQKSWNEINNEFYSEVEKITGAKWKFSEYRVVLSPFHPGVSNRENNTVVRWIYETGDGQKRITAHEILMIHIWDIFDGRYPEAKQERWGGGPFWGLNEITTTLILGLEPALNKMWTPDKQGVDNFLQNYPQLAGLKEELKQIYLNKKDFADYLTQAVAKLTAIRHN